MAKRSAVYCIKNRVTGRLYVGSAVHVEQRWRDHRRLLNLEIHHSIKLQQSWRKHGAAAFEFIVLEDVPEVSKLLDREQQWLLSTNAAVDGYNILPRAGSHLGAVRDAATRARMSAAAKGKKKPRTPEHQAALVASRKGYVTPPELRARISATLTGRRNIPHSPETRAKLSTAAKKRGMPRATQEKAWAATRGKPRSPRRPATIFKPEDAL